MISHTPDLPQRTSLRELTPYDTGARLEPHLWMGTSKRAAITASVFGDRFGKVDFDDNEGATLATPHFERATNAAPEDPYTLKLSVNAPTVIETDDGQRILVNP